MRFRKQRNLSDDSGDRVPISAAAGCLLSAKDLLAHVRAWLKTHKPERISRPFPLAARRHVRVRLGHYSSARRGRGLKREVAL